MQYFTDQLNAMAVRVIRAHLLGIRALQRKLYVRFD